MNSDKLYIRNFHAGDFAEVDHLWKLTGMGGSIRADDEQVILETIRIGGQLLILADKESDEIIGTSWLTLDGRRIFIHHFGILPAYQGNGFSHILMKESLNYARKTGLQIKLEVHKKNEKAIALYKKYGFGYLGDYDVYIIRDYSKLKL